MFFADALTLDASRRSPDGYMGIRAKAARVGAYEYSGRDVDPDNAHGLRDQAIVNVLREPSEVFDARSLGSFIAKPITDDHPSESVTARNWRDFARGTIMGAVKDGDHVGFDLAFLDADTVAKVDAGKVELSNGYTCKLEFGDFTAADGTKCQARQTNITGNHIALVDRGRAGPTCRVGDAPTTDTAPQSFLDSLKPQEKPVKTMLIDGLTVDVSNADTAVATITTILAARDTALGKVAAIDTELATLKVEVTTKDAKIVTLEQAVKDAKPTPAQLRDAGKALMIAAGQAKALGVTVTDTMDEPAIMSAVVTAKMGDKAKDWNEAQIAASFAVLAKDVKVADGSALDRAISGQPVNMGDAQAEYQDAQAKRKQELRDAWKTPANSNAVAA